MGLSAPTQTIPFFTFQQLKICHVQQSNNLYCYMYNAQQGPTMSEDASVDLNIVYLLVAYKKLDK